MIFFYSQFQKHLRYILEISGALCFHSSGILFMLNNFNFYQDLFLQSYNSNSLTSDAAFFRIISKLSFSLNYATISFLSINNCVSTVVFNMQKNLKSKFLQGILLFFTVLNLLISRIKFYMNLKHCFVHVQVQTGL